MLWMGRVVGRYLSGEIHLKHGEEACSKTMLKFHAPHILVLSAVDDPVALVCALWTWVSAASVDALSEMRSRNLNRTV